MKNKLKKEEIENEIERLETEFESIQYHGGASPGNYYSMRRFDLKARIDHLKSLLEGVK